MIQHRKLWGRAQSHPLSSTQKDILSRGLEKFSFKNNIANDTTHDTIFAPDILEIGFGDGEHFLSNVRQYPGKNFLGCEPFLNGNVNVLKAMEDEGMTHARLFMDDVHLLLPLLKENSLEAIYVLFPDPWPKKRQQKRRILNREFITSLAEKLKHSGNLFMASDDPAYQEFICEETSTVTSLSKIKEMTPPLTKYARKAAKAGRTSIMYMFERM